jgi:hypothetical protein
MDMKTKMTPETMRDAGIVTDAYVALLCLPLTSISRMRVQSVLASLRDELAHLTGSQPETVQMMCEAIAEQRVERGRKQ